MMIGNTNDPTGAATPIVGPGNNSCTDCITIPLEEYRKLIECSVNMDIINDLADGRNIYKTLTGASDMVSRTEYQNLQNVMAEKISDLQTELRQKGEYIANLERQARDRSSAHICPVCGRQFFEDPAVSRRDPDMKICSVCAATEALEDAQKAGSISRGEAKEIQKIVEDVAKETKPEEMMEDVPAGEEGEEVVPRVSTPEQCKRGGKKNKPGTKANLPMEEIMRLKEEGWSNVKIAKKYDVTDVTIGSRIKSYLAEKKATVEMIRKLREEGWTYEKIEDVHGIPEEKIREMLREAGRAKKEGSSEDK